MRKIREIYEEVVKSKNFVKKANEIAKAEGTTSPEILEACLHVALRKMPAD